MVYWQSVAHLVMCKPVIFSSCQLLFFYPGINASATVVWYSKSIFHPHFGPKYLLYYHQWQSLNVLFYSCTDLFVVYGVLWHYFAVCVSREVSMLRRCIVQKPNLSINVRNTFVYCFHNDNGIIMIVMGGNKEKV